MKRKIFIGFCIFFVILLIGGYIFLRSSFFTAKVRLAMESVLKRQLGREVSVGEVTGNIFGSISIAGISVAKDKKLSDGKLIEIEDVTAGYSLLSLLRWRFVIKSIRVARPRIWLERDEEGQLNLPNAGRDARAPGDEGKRSRFSVLVSNLDMFSGELMFDDRKNSIRTVVSGINVRLRGSGREMEYSGKFRAEKMEIDVQGMSKTIFNLASSFETSKEGLKFSDLQLQLGRSNLQAKGEIAGWDKPIPYESPQISAEIRSRLFLEDVRDFFLYGRTQGSPLHRLDGVAEIYGVVSGKMPDLAGVCEIDLPIMHVNDLEVRNVNAEAEFAQNTISLTDVSADLTEGSAKLKGMIQLADGKVSKYDSVLKLDHLDIGRIITALNGSDAPISGHLSGEVSVSGKQFRLGSIDLDARFSMLDTRWRNPASSIEDRESRIVPIGTVNASLSVEGESIALNVSRDKADKDVRAPTAVELEGKLGDDGKLDLSVGIDGFDAGEITSLLTGSPLIIGEGHISADIGMRIVDPEIRASMGLPPVDSHAKMRSIADLQVRVNVDMPDLRLPVGMGKTQDARQEQEISSLESSRSDPAGRSYSPESIRIGSLTGTINLVDDRLRVDEMVLQLGESKSLVTAEVQNAGYWILDTGYWKEKKESSIEHQASSIKHPLIDAKLTIDSLQIENYLRLLGGGQTRGSPLQISGGLVNGELEVHGEIMDMNGRGQVSVTGLSMGDRDIDPISVPIEIESSILIIPNLVVSSAGEQITVASRISPSGDYNLQVDSSSIDLSKLYGQVSNLPLPISGTAQISLSGSGNVGGGRTRGSPLQSLNGKLKLNRLGYNGEDFGSGECIFVLRDEKVHVDVSLLERAYIATLDVGIQHPFPFKGIIQLGNINLEPALNLAGLGEKIDLRIAGSIDVDGEGASGRDGNRPLRADVTLQTVLLDAEGHRWTNDLPIRFGVNDGEFWVSQAKMKGAGGQLSVSGKFDTAGDIDLDVAVGSVDLAAISELLDLPKPVIGRADCTLRVGGDISSPSILLKLDVSNVAYEQMDMDRISAQISYKERIGLEVEKLVFNTFGGETRIEGVLLLDLDLRNLPTPDELVAKPIYASLDAEDLSLSFIPLFVPQVLAAGGKADDVHLEMTGRIMQPKIGGSLKLKDTHFQLESLPVPIENLNGSLSVRSRERKKTGDSSRSDPADRLYGLESLEYEASLKLGWEMEKGKYDARFSILDTGYWILDAWHRALRIEDRVSSIGQPDFQFDLEVRDGKLGSLVREMAKDPLLPVDGNFSGKLHLYGSMGPWVYGSIDLPLRGDLMMSSIDLTVNGHKVKNRGRIKISFADGTLEILDFQLLTLVPPVGNAGATHALPAQIGSIAASGKISMDETFELDIEGEHLHPGLFSFLLDSPKPISGDLTFGVRTEGKLDSPIISLSLVASDMVMPIPSANGETKIDDDKSPQPPFQRGSKRRVQRGSKGVVPLVRGSVLCEISYRDETLNVEKLHIDSFDNELDVSGTLPVGLSLTPPAVRFLDREMDVQVVMNIFNPGVLSHLTDEIEGALYITPVQGNAEADVRMLGSLKDPRLIGEFQLSNAACRLTVARDQSPATRGLEKPDESGNYRLETVEMENINLSVSMDDGQIVMDNMTFQIGEGRYEAQGKIEVGQGLEPQLFDLAFKASPVEIDPFLQLVGQDLASSVSGEIMVSGQLNGDFRELRGKPILDKLKAISGDMLISEEGIKVDAAGHTITNPKRIYAEFQNGNLDLPSLKLIDKTAVGVGLKPARTSSIAAFGAWEIGGEKSFEATVNLDMGLVSKLIRQPELMSGWLGFKIQAHGQEVQLFWPAGEPESQEAREPESRISGLPPISIGHATIDRFEGKVIYREQEIYVEQVRISSGKNHIVFSGNVPMTGKKMDLRFDARLDDMGILSFISKDITESSGRGSIGATITGDIKKVIAKEEPVRFVGYCEFDDLDVNFDRSNMKFEDLEIDVEFTDKGFIAVKTLGGKMNGGEFFLDVDQSAQPGAEIIWEKETGYRIGELRDISITMKDFTLYRPMVYSMLFNGKLMLKGKFDAPIITGNITVNEGEYTESLDGFVQRLLSSREIGVKAFLDYPLVQDLKLDVNVQVTGDVRMDNSLVNVETKLDLSSRDEAGARVPGARVQGSLLDPIVLVQAKIEGKFSYLGRKFTITKGEINNGSEIDPEIDPKYDITAETEITNAEDVNTDTPAGSTKIQMELKGSLSELRAPTFTPLVDGEAQRRSNMSQTDIIAILTLGSTPEEFLSKALSTSSPLLMEPAKWYVEAQAEKHLNLKEFQMQIDLNDYKETRLVMAKQLMEQISVLVDVGYGGLERIGLQYDMSKHFALEGKLSQKGDWDFDLKIERDFP